MLIIFRVAAVFFGLGLLAFGLWDLVVPRARFVSSSPPPAATIAAPPAAVLLNFSDRLGNESTFDVTSTIRVLPSGEKEYLDGRSVAVTSGIDPADPNGKSLRANLQPGLHPGLYWVNWRTKAASWGSITYGKTYFAVGMAAPENITRDLGGATWERNYQWRSRRAALAGGAVLIALGLFMRTARGRPSAEA